MTNIVRQGLGQVPATGRKGRDGASAVAAGTADFPVSQLIRATLIQREK